MVSTGAPCHPECKAVCDALNKDRISYAILRITEKDNDIASIKDKKNSPILRVWKIFRKSIRSDEVKEIPLSEFLVDVNSDAYKEAEEKDRPAVRSINGKDGSFGGWTYLKKYGTTHGNSWYGENHKKGIAEFRKLWDSFSSQVELHGNPDNTDESLGEMWVEKLKKSKRQPPQPCFGVLKYRYWTNPKGDASQIAKDTPLIVLYGDDSYSSSKKRLDWEENTQVRDDGFNRRFVSTGGIGMVKDIVAGGVLVNIDKSDRLRGEESHGEFLQKCIVKQSPEGYFTLIQLEAGKNNTEEKND